MSAPGRRSKWDQGPVDSGTPSVGVLDGVASTAVSGSSEVQNANNGNSALNAPLDSAASRAAAFLSSNLSSSSGPSSSVSSGPVGWLPPGHPDKPPAVIFSGEVNINGCRPEIRYVMTSRDTFDSIEEETGVKIEPRGTFRQTDGGVSHSGEGLAPEDRPLHLYVTADSQEKVDKACAKLKTLMERPSTTPSGLLMNKVYIPFAADVDPGFSLPGKIIGPGGSFVRHIQTTSGCKVHLRGKGSYMEGGPRQEAQEALHLFITGPTEAQVQHAKELAEGLIASVKRKYDAFLAERKAGVLPAPAAPLHNAPPSGPPYAAAPHGHHGPPPQNFHNPPPGHAAPPGPHSDPSAHPQSHTPPAQPGYAPHPQANHTAYDPTSTYSPQRSPSGARPPYPPHNNAPHLNAPNPDYYSNGYGNREHNLRPPPPAARGPTPPPPAPNAPPHGAPPNQYAQPPPPSYQNAGPGNRLQPGVNPTAQDYRPADANAYTGQTYSEWTPEAITAYYAYYGMPIPPEYAQYLAAAQAAQAAQAPQTAQTAQTAQPPPPPPSKPTSTAPVEAQEMEMEMDDDETEFVLPPVVAKGKRSLENSAADKEDNKRPKLDETPPSTAKPFWASTSSNRSNVLTPSARQPDR